MGSPKMWIHFKGKRKHKGAKLNFPVQGNDACGLWADDAESIIEGADRILEEGAKYIGQMD